VGQRGRAAGPWGGMGVNVWVSRKGARTRGWMREYLGKAPFQSLGIATFPSNQDTCGLAREPNRVEKTTRILASFITWAQNLPCW
jgi:hypothetical protein